MAIYIAPLLSDFPFKNCKLSNSTSHLKVKEMPDTCGPSLSSNVTFEILKLSGLRLLCALSAVDSPCA